jgi:sulfite reductase (ferredoxin)
MCWAMKERQVSRRGNPVQPIFHLPDVFKDDAKRFKDETERFKSGAVSAAEFRSFRVPMGVYEQREADTFMLRVRFPGGAVLPHQMHALAAVARRYGNGVLHVTTRQDIQINRVLIITACQDAGVCQKEVFDPSSHAVALTEFLLPDPLSYQLPRKYKIAFSGCSEDCSGASVHDLGFFAKHRNGSVGFTVFIGGGLGAGSRVADLFEEFVPVDEVHLVAEAVKRVFDKHGNRKNRNKARLRFLIDKIGLEGFRELYEGEMAELRKAAPPRLELRESPGGEPPGRAAGAQPVEGFAEWRWQNVSPQQQHGYHLVQIPLVLGDIPADTLERLANVVEQHAEGMLRTTQSQNLILRWAHETELSGLHAELSDLGLASSDPPVLRNLVACMGASTCKLGICLSRGLAKALRAELEKGVSDLDGLEELRIHVSGCPNACGRHPIADVGLHGAARRVKGRLVPHYVLQLGGKVAEGQARLAQGKYTIPARNVPAVLCDLLDTFRRSAQCPDFGSFLEAQSNEYLKELAAKYGEVPDFQEDKNYYFDWDAEEIFSLAGRGPGECGAGVFDLIEVDLASARDALSEDRLFDATVFAARCLLVTRGAQAEGEAEALELFTRHFIDEGLVDASLRNLIEGAGKAAKAPQAASTFAAERAEVAGFVETIQTLFKNMDPSLRFKPMQDPGPAAGADAESQPKIAREADFRGVVCPLNYVKTKMLLDQMGNGEVLSVRLDEAGSRNVPESVEGDGHEVVSVEATEEHWRVLIRKAQP